MSRGRQIELERAYQQFAARLLQYGVPIDVVRKALANGLGSAVALAIGDAGREVLRFADGTTARVPHAGSPVSDATLFDVASLTKPMVTTLLAMRMVGEGRLELNAPLARWVATTSTATIADALGHAAGLPAHVPFFADLRRGDRDGLVRAAGSTAMIYPPRSQAIYSDLGYILLGAALESAGEARLDEQFAVAAHELGLVARFVPLDQPWRPDAVATEVDSLRGLVCGEVHDENCWAAGGVAGHAGLFASIADVSRFAQIMVQHASNTASANAMPGRLRSDIVQHFLATSPSGTSWRLGWDTPTGAESSAGDLWPRNGVGHLGFTGTSLWLDLARGRWVALLTNRVHPSRHESVAAIRNLRRAVMDAAVRMLDSRARAYG